MQKIEPTFIFVAVLALGLLGYGLTGNFISNDKVACETACKNITLQENFPACAFNGTFFRKDFFIDNFPNCKQNIEECEKQFCGAVSYRDPAKLEECTRLCAR